MPKGEFTHKKGLDPSLLVILLGIIGVIILCKHYENICIRNAAISMYIFAFCFMSVSLKAVAIYYSPLIPFCIPVCIRISKFLNIKNVYIAGVAIFIFSVTINFQLIKKICHIGEAQYAYESAYIMNDFITNKSDNILVMGESLYYNLTGTLPHIKLFTMFAIPSDTYNDCWEEWKKSLLSGENRYIITRGDPSHLGKDNNEDISIERYLSNNYKVLVDYHVNESFRAILYEKD